MGESENKQWLMGVFLAVGGTFLFALKSIFIKLAYQEGASVESVLILRMLFAAPFYIGMLIYLNVTRGVGGAKVGLRAVAGMVAVGFLGYYLASYLDLSGLQYISAQLERLTLFTYPTMIAVLAAIFLGEKVTRVIVISLLFCYGGLWVMYGQELNHVSGGHAAKGVGLVLGSAFCYSLYVIFAKPMIQKFGSKFFTSLAMLGSTFFVAVHCLVLGGLEVFQVNGKVYFFCVALAFLCTVLPSYMIAAAIGSIGATRTSVLGTVGPVFTIGLAVVLLDEPFGWGHLLGVFLVLWGVGMVSLKK